MQGTPAVLYAGWAAGSEFRDFPPEWEKLAARPQKWMFRIAVPYLPGSGWGAGAGAGRGWTSESASPIGPGWPAERGVGDVGLRVRRVALHMTSRTVADGHFQQFDLMLRTSVSGPPSAI